MRYLREWDFSTWPVALEVAGYWHPTGAHARIYKDGTRGPHPWMVQVTTTRFAGMDERWVAIP